MKEETEMSPVFAEEENTELFAEDLEDTDLAVGEAEDIKITSKAEPVVDSGIIENISKSCLNVIDISKDITNIETMDSKDLFDFRLNLIVDSDLPAEEKKALIDQLVADYHAERRKTIEEYNEIRNQKVDSFSKVLNEFEKLIGICLLGKIAITIVDSISVNIQNSNDNNHYSS